MFLGLKLDEDLSPRVSEIFTSVGYDVATVVDQGWSGFKDPQLWRQLQHEKRMLVTADRGFGDIRAYPPGTHCGIILLRPNNESILKYCELAKSLRERHRLEQLHGTVTVVSARSIRIRRINPS